MGYRSDVCLVVGKEVLPKFMTVMTKHPAVAALCMQEYDKKIEDYDDDGAMLFYWSGIKWYSSFRDIEAIGEFMDWCDEDDARAFDYRFVRIGEENDDVVVRGDGFWEVGVERSITY
jgi:hypothetical protein